jgi:large subunit ribosomal protein L31e
MEEGSKKEEPKTEEKKEEVAEAVEEESVVESLEKELQEEEKPLEEEEAEAEEEAPKAEAEEKEEAEKPSRKEKKKEEEEIVEERTYTVPLSKAWVMPANKRAPKAMRILKAFMVKHMKLKATKKAEGEEEEEPGALIISNEVNERMWSKGIEKPPRNIRVRAAKDKDGNVTVYLAEGD